MRDLTGFCTARAEMSLLLDDFRLAKLPTNEVPLAVDSAEGLRRICGVLADCSFAEEPDELAVGAWDVLRPRCKAPEMLHFLPGERGPAD